MYYITPFIKIVFQSQFDMFTRVLKTGNGRKNWLKINLTFITFRIMFLTERKKLQSKVHKVQLEHS